VPADDRRDVLKFRDSSNHLAPLQGGQAFVVYWAPRPGRQLSPLGLNTDQDVIPLDKVGAEEVIQFKLGSTNPEGGTLQYRVGNGAWGTLTQSRGDLGYQLSTVDEPYKLRGVKRCITSHDGIVFSLRIDVAGTDDGWISGSLSDGNVIRMRDMESEAAQLVAVRAGSGVDDAVGKTGTFPRRTWEDLVNGSS